MTTERQYPDMWVDPDDDPRDSDTEVTGERDTLLDYLKHYRLTLELKCQDLDAEQMARRSVPPSTMSLLGLVRHMAKVENNWFLRVMQQQPESVKLYWSEEDRDLDFNGAVPDQTVVDDAWTSWRREVAAAEAYVAGVESMDHTVPFGDDGTIELRDVLVHMIEEYARHCGHADLLRECVDGRTGQ